MLGLSHTRTGRVARTSVFEVMFRVLVVQKLLLHR